MGKKQYVVIGLGRFGRAVCETLYENGAEVLAALTMRYDDELDGWFLDQRVEDAALVERMLQSAMQ